MKWDDDRYIAFDFETSGTLPEYALQPWRFKQGKAWATSLAIVHKAPDQLVIQGGLYPTVDMMRAFLEQAIAEDRRIVGWNTVFDVMWLLAYGLGDLVFKAKWLDGMLLWKHATIEPEYDAKPGAKKSYRLKDCVREFMPQFSDYEENVDFHDTHPAARKALHDYNIRDTMFTLRLAKKWWGTLEKQQQRVALIEADSIPLVAQANLHGMLIDTLSANALSCELKVTAAERLASLRDDMVNTPMVTERPLRGKKAQTEDQAMEAIVRSPLKLAQLLYDCWGLTPTKMNKSKETGKVTRSTDKEVLHELAFDDPRAMQLREYREALNNDTKFAQGPVVAAHYNDDGRAHPQAIIFGTYTSRMTYSSKQGRNKDERPIGFACHQMKRGPQFRGAVIAPPGYTIMEFDASGQEFRFMAIASNDPTMLHLCRPGEDPHSYMGARINHVDYHAMMIAVKEGDRIAKDGRQLGKVGNLSLQYRTSARKLCVVARVQYNIPMTIGQAERIHFTYQKTYPQVPKYWDKQIAVVKRLGYAETLAGRRVEVKGNWGGRNGWSMGSTAINYRIQGTGGDQKYLALAIIKPYLTEIGAYFFLDLHDGLYLFVPDHRVPEAAVKIKAMLDNLPYKRVWGLDPPITLPWDCKTGSSWGNLKDYKFE